MQVNTVFLGVQFSSVRTNLTPGSRVDPELSGPEEDRLGWL